MKKEIRLSLLISFILLTLMGCASFTHREAEPTPLVEQGTENRMALFDSPQFFQQSPEVIWRKLQPLSLNKLSQLQSDATTELNSGWIALALISKQQEADIKTLADALLNWRLRYPSHPANALIPNSTVLNQLLLEQTPNQIALLLPLHTTHKTAGQAVREGVLQGYYSRLARTHKPQHVRFYDTSLAPDITLLYQQAIREGADFVIGPLLKEEVQKLSTGSPIPVSTLALNYTLARSLPKNFYEFGLLTEDEMAQMVKKARESGLSHALLIAPQNAWGQQLTRAFQTTWQNAGGKIQDTWYYGAPSTFSAQIAQLLRIDTTQDKKLMTDAASKNTLQQQRRHDFDVVFLFAKPYAARVIIPLLRYYYVTDVPLYALSSIYGNLASPEKNVDLGGVILCDIPLNIKRVAQNRGDSSTYNRLYAVGQDAYRISQALPRLVALSYFPLYGATGALTLSPNTQEIHRSLPCHSIQQGQF